MRPEGFGEDLPELILAGWEGQSRALRGPSDFSHPQMGGCHVPDLRDTDTIK